ncbi:MAG: hypothetical protein D6679_08255 [Candidatus Hydrogenedentota bacterium]|nr:MAG: hypothetical protein D6679_08255 [Candidatus Hydrogenedentota bacterium]
MRSSLLILLLGTVLPSGAVAESGRAGAFLLGNVGARSQGLGNAVTAFSDDVTAFYGNPALMTALDHYQVFLDATRTHPRDLSLAASIGIPFQRKTTLALGVRSFQPNGDVGRFRIGNTGDYRFFPAVLPEDDRIFEAGVARRLFRGLSIGAAARFLDFSVEGPFYGNERYRGLHGSFGFSYNSAKLGLVLGGKIENFGTRISGDRNVDLPLLSTIGISKGRLIHTAHYIAGSVEGVKLEGKDWTARAGIEYWWANVVGVRAGFDGLAGRFGGNPYRGRYTLGISARFRGALFDLSYVPSRGSQRNSLLSASFRMTFGEGRRK